MNDIGNEPRPAANGELIEDLRRQVNMLFGALVIVSFTLTGFLVLQAHRASLELVNAQIAADQMTKAVQQDDALMENTFEKLREFARTHPDFEKQVLSNFRHNTNSPSATPAKK